LKWRLHLSVPSRSFSAFYFQTPLKLPSSVPRSPLTPTLRINMSDEGSTAVEKKRGGRPAKADKGAGDAEVKETKKRGKPAADKTDVKKTDDGEAPVKRGRGRPPKGEKKAAAAKPKAKGATGKRGRPKKVEKKEESEEEVDEDAEEENGEEEDDE